MMSKKEGKIAILKIRNSRKMYIPIYFMVGVLILSLVYIEASGKPLNSIAIKSVILFLLACVIYTEVHRIGNLYEINKNSLVHTMGYFTKRSRRMDFSAISDLYVVQNIWQRLFSYGNIEVRLFSGEEITYIKNINNPSKFVEILLTKINKKKL